MHHALQYFNVYSLFALIILTYFLSYTHTPNLEMLSHLKIRACAIADPKSDTVIIIGGCKISSCTDEVIRYDISGNQTPLPSLNYPRYFFGCSGYYNNVGNLVSKK